MRALVLVAALVSAPALAQDVTGSIPRVGSAEDFDLSAAARLPPAFPEFSASWSPERFVAAPLGSYAPVRARRTEPEGMLGLLLSPQPLGDLAPLDRPDGTVARR
jgi:hypothetical protein